jgi:hypothetical protein
MNKTVKKKREINHNEGRRERKKKLKRTWRDIFTLKITTRNFKENLDLISHRHHISNRLAEWVAPLYDLKAIKHKITQPNKKESSLNSM